MYKGVQCKLEHTGYSKYIGRIRYTGYTRVYRVYKDIQGVLSYTGYTWVYMGYKVYRVYKGI